MIIGSPYPPQYLFTVAPPAAGRGAVSGTGLQLADVPDQLPAHRPRAVTDLLSQCRGQPGYLAQRNAGQVTPLGREADQPIPLGQRSVARTPLLAGQWTRGEPRSNRDCRRRKEPAEPPVSWYALTLDYTAVKWKYASPNHRRSIAEALTDATEVLILWGSEIRFAVSRGQLRSDVILVG